MNQCKFSVYKFYIEIGQYLPGLEVGTLRLRADTYPVSLGVKRIQEGLPTGVVEQGDRLHRASGLHPRVPVHQHCRILGLHVSNLE